MGGFASKRKGDHDYYDDSHNKSCSSEIRSKEKMIMLQEEIDEMMWEREEERRGYEREVMVFAIKEAEWKRERKKLKEEVKRLGKMVEEKEEKMRAGVLTKDGLLINNGDSQKWSTEEKDYWPEFIMGSSFLVEQMREERARRDEAVEKWKQLYLAIKTELDDLIQRTNGDSLYWRAEEEEIIEELRKEVKAKEETIEMLKARIVTMDREEFKKAREIDILRQSLRIMSNNKKTTTSHPSKSLHQYFL